MTVEEHDTYTHSYPVGITLDDPDEPLRAMTLLTLFVSC